MSGTVTVKIACRSAGTPAAKAHEFFKGWFDHMEALAAAGRIVRIGSTPGVFGPGTGYPDDNRPFSPGSRVKYCWPPTPERGFSCFLQGILGHATPAGHVGLDVSSFMQSEPLVSLTFQARGKQRVDCIDFRKLTDEAVEYGFITDDDSFVLYVDEPDPQTTHWFVYSLGTGQKHPQPVRDFPGFVM